MSIPAMNKTEMCQVDKQNYNSVVYIENTTGADLATNDFTVIDDVWCGTVNQEALDGEMVAVTVQDGLQILTSNVAALATLDAQGIEIFWDPTLLEFTDISAVGHFTVGYLITPVNSAGVILFEKLRRPVEVTA